jgi:farnesyl-diphosphate farnesyltransferase
MAMLTLRKLNRNQNVSDSFQVKISRRSIKVAIMTMRLTCGSNFLVRLVYYPASLGLPAVDGQVVAINPKALTVK